MGWFNEFEWFVIMLAVMKLAILFFVVYATKAHRSCEDQCECLTSDTRDIVLLPECDCVYQGKEDHELHLDTAIFYEPADYISLPSVIYGNNMPFYIINPYVVNSEKVSSHTDNDAQNIQHSTHPGSNSEIKVNIEKVHASRKRNGKETEVDNKRRSPVYLDINVEPEGSDTSPTNMFITDDLKLTEPSLLECADLYTLLNSRQSDNHDDSSYFDLTNKINEKCSRISYIIENSQKEIMEKRPRKNSKTLNILRNQHHSKPQMDNKLEDVTYRNDRTSTESGPAVQQTQERKSDFKQDNNNQEYTGIVYTENSSQDYTDDTNNKSSPQTSHITVASTLNRNVESTIFRTHSLEANAKVPITSNREILINDKYPGVTLINAEDKNTLNNEIVKSSTALTSKNEFSSPSNLIMDSTNYGEQNENERTNEKEFETIEFEEHTKVKNRTQYKETEVPLVKVITQEFNNNTVQSFINGTEKLPNGDFEDDSEEEIGSNELMETSKRPTPSEIETSVSEVDRFLSAYKSPDVAGYLYFLYNNQQIPARFVQKPNGAVHIGIDGVTICNELTQTENKSMLLKTLCNCYTLNDCGNKN